MRHRKRRAQAVGVAVTVLRALVAATAASRAARLERIRALTATPARGYLVPSRAGGAALVAHRAPSGDAPWRVTWLGADGEPRGHVDASSPSGALLTAWDLGGDIGRAEALGVPAEDPEPWCPECHGRGFLREPGASVVGLVTGSHEPRACPRCEGTGYEVLP